MEDRNVFQSLSFPRYQMKWKIVHIDIGVSHDRNTQSRAKDFPRGKLADGAARTYYKFQSEVCRRVKIVYTTEFQYFRMYKMRQEQDRSSQFFSCRLSLKSFCLSPFFSHFSIEDFAAGALSELARGENLDWNRCSAVVGASTEWKSNWMANTPWLFTRPTRSHPRYASIWDLLCSTK